MSVRCQILHRLFWENYDSFVAPYRRCRVCGRVYGRVGWRWEELYRLRDGWFKP